MPKMPIKTVRDSAASWNINPLDVGIMGSSAGGHLASTISTHADFAHRPDFSILFYPVISMNNVILIRVPWLDFLAMDVQTKIG